LFLSKGVRSSQSACVMQLRLRRSAEAGCSVDELQRKVETGSSAAASVDEEPWLPEVRGFCGK
jgi:hypothetical protein